MLKKGDIDQPDYTSKGTDFVLVTADLDEGPPLCLAWGTDRAKALLISWGMEDLCIGIALGEEVDPNDVLPHIPEDYTISSCLPEEGMHAAMQVPLPPQVSVVH